VPQRDGDELQAEQIEGSAVERMQLQPGNVRFVLPIREDVLEDPAHGCDSIRTAKDGDRRGLVVVEGAHVVEAH